MALTVKAVAEMAGISVRTLHHYDAIGLLKPAQATEAGYRLYTNADLERLQQVLFFRELGFSLQEIREILASPSFDRKQALLSHRQLLLERQQRLGRLVQSVECTLEAMERGINMNGKEMFEGFDQSKYEEEVRQRWGHTEAYQESQRRTRSYTKEDWVAIKEESRKIEEGIASLMDREPGDADVQALISQHHRSINERFYACSSQMYRGLADMYVQDERFAGRYEKIKPGMAQFMYSAIHAYCDVLDATAVK